MHYPRHLCAPVGSLLAATVLVLVGSLRAQAPAPTAPPVAQPPLAPATKLEGFKPAAGSVVTFGYNNLGHVGGLLGVSVDVREMRDAHGVAVRGLVVEVYQSQYREERSFVDADEIPELLKGIDALLDVQANPTSFENFEVRYTTRGELQLATYNSGKADIRYAVRAGRVVTSQRTDLSADDMRKLRALFQAALDKLNSIGAKD